jgi:uncharacterized repeat protein (TIGR01451 family)
MKLKRIVNFGLAVLLLLAGMAGPSQVRPVHAAGIWYVAPGGDDLNDCMSPSSPCATINAALDKGGAESTIKVAQGVYPGHVSVWATTSLLGGWNKDFTEQSDLSIIDGQRTQQGLSVEGLSTFITVDHFLIRNGNAKTEYDPGGGGGILNNGQMTLSNSVVTNNTADGGGGIWNGGALIINNSYIGSNSGRTGGGIGQFYGYKLEITNSTIANNAASYGGGIYSYYQENVFLNNVTIVNNTATVLGGGIMIEDHFPEGIVIRNSILANNAGPASSPDCSAILNSQGYNLFKDTTGCAIVGDLTGNLTGVDPHLSPIVIEHGYYPLASNSPAIDAGNPGGCLDNQNTPLLTDQRGMGRVGRCDIGAYESGLATDLKVNGVFRPGGQVTYTLQVHSELPAAFTDVIVTDALPDVLTLVPGSLTFTNGAGQADGNSIQWKGTVSNSPQTVISFAAVISEVGTYWTEITNMARVAWGSTSILEAASFDTISRAYLPICLTRFCSDYFDDFSNPASGWSVINNANVRSQYKAGEFRVNSKVPNYYLFRAPTICEHQDYTVEVDVRWTQTYTEASVGLIFGITPNFDQFYMFIIETVPLGEGYHLYRYDSSGFVFIGGYNTSDLPINSGTASNHLKVTRLGNQITAEANGSRLETWTDTTITGFTGAGLVSSASDKQHVTDAYFDNFRVTALYGVGAAATNEGQAAPTIGLDGMLNLILPFEDLP